MPLGPLAAEPSWTEIPGVRLVGAIIGTVLLIAAIRAVFKGRR